MKMLLFPSMEDKGVSIDIDAIEAIVEVTEESSVIYTATRGYQVKCNHASIAASIAAAHQL